jgi:hypothetical protein
MVTLKSILDLPFIQVALPIVITFAIATWYQSKRVDDLSKRVDDLRADMNGRFDEVGRRFDEVARRFDEVGRRLERIELKPDDHAGRILKLEERTSPFRV